MNERIEVAIAQRLTQGADAAARPMRQAVRGCAIVSNAPRSGDFRMRDRDAMTDNERAARIEHENKLIRRLRFLVELTFATIAQDQSMTLDQAWDHVHALKGAAVAMFPGKDDTFDLLYLPRFSRLLAERFRAN
ncbi:MAG: hypothetical protein ABSC63_10795 [Candidatus Binataceae bacterium]